ncbi:oligosaccharide flippase family protein [Halobacillus aidingensis]|uniref:Peptidoglycan biosynthesis protein MviN/MurJ, putative lipid II flippase n=1 Tax=Halobacillus aidingensis TaxID=240303 RepID=A0A1H0KJL3_HALAD|nr:oligosaccharide flippase family protein [Halobacillus aidingensis]SDO55950.1 Peptidoglycan biosynthesis protein MviN/MurJ, putative lipid II flippase [Halobacillus aidingensis]
MKTDIGSDALKLTISKLVSLIVSFGSVMILARYLSLKEFGTYTQLLLIINILTTLFVLGLPNSINYFLAKAENRMEQQSFLSVYYSLSTILGFVTGISLLMSAPIITGFFKNPLLNNFIYFLVIFPWAKIILMSIDHVLIVYKKANYLFLFRLINSLLLLLIVVLTAYLQLSFNIYITMFLIVESILAICVYLIVKNISGSISINLDIASIKQIFKFSIPIGLASTVGLLSIQLDKIVISQFFSAEELAIYANAARELPIAIIATSLTAVLMPQMVRLLKVGENIKAIRVWGDTIYISYTIMCFFSTVLFIFASDIIILLYSEKYLGGTVVFQIYSIFLLLRFTYFGIVLNSIGKTKLILYSSLGSLGLNLILNYLFYYLFGLIGPAIASVVSMLLIAFLQLIVTSKNLNVSFSNIFPWHSLFRITVINVILGLLFLYIKSIIPIEEGRGGVVESIVLGIIWLGVYFIIMGKKVKYRWDNINQK